jgi:hypothetical protein
MNIQFAVKVDGDSPNRHSLRTGSESSRQPNVTVCVEGNWSFPGKNRRQGDGRMFR